MYGILTSKIRCPKLSKVVMAQRTGSLVCCVWIPPQTQCVTLMLANLTWKTLNKHQAYNKVILLYRFVHGLVAIPSGLPYTMYIVSLPRKELNQRTLPSAHTCTTESSVKSNPNNTLFFPSVLSLWSTLHRLSSTVRVLYLFININSEEDCFYSHFSNTTAPCFQTLCSQIAV